MTLPSPPAQGSIYEADHAIYETVKHCRERIHQICRAHMHRRVLVRTVQGQCYEGTIVGFDDLYLYLDRATPGEMRPPYPVVYPVYPPFFNPYSASILPLVLFNLLTISLLY